MASFPKAAHRVRRIAYQTPLDLAVRARAAVMPRQKLRPYAMIERSREGSVTARSSLNVANSFSFARQIAYTNDGNKIARRASRVAASGGGGGGGGAGGGGSGGGGGGWPF